MSMIIDPYRFVVSGSFSPDDLADLEFWFDASDASTITDAGGGLVSQWDDKSVNGVDVSQGVSGDQPSISTFGGFDSILFTTTKVLNALTISVPTGSGTMFAVVTATSTSGTRVIFNSDDGATTSALRLDSSTGTTNLTASAAVSSGSSSNMTITGGVPLNTTIAAIARHVDSDTSVMEDDSGNTGSDANVGTLRTSIDDMFVGARIAAASNAWLGHIHELGYYSQVLSDVNKTSLMNYLKTKWGL